MAEIVEVPSAGMTMAAHVAGPKATEADFYRDIIKLLGWDIQEYFLTEKGLYEYVATKDDQTVCVVDAVGGDHAILALFEHIKTRS